MWAQSDRRIHGIFSLFPGHSGRLENAACCTFSRRQIGISKLIFLLLLRSAFVTIIIVIYVYLIPSRRDIMYFYI
jgi:hypothetical protein